MIWSGADLTWGRFDWGRFDLGPIWFGADLTWGRFGLGPIWPATIWKKTFYSLYKAFSIACSQVMKQTNIWFSGPVNFGNALVKYIIIVVFFLLNYTYGYYWLVVHNDIMFIQMSIFHKISLV